MSLLLATIGPDAPHRFNTIIEIPRGSTNKYEVDAETGIVKLDRVLYSPLFYPFDYGYIPQTKYIDGDPIDVLVMLSHPTVPGCMVEAHAVGVLEMKDEKGPDEKILCVADRDPRFSNRKSLKDLQPHTLAEIQHFFDVYKALEDKHVEIGDWRDVDYAIELIERYRTDR
ncbi:MAG TPA: inorganic diphosphatase [Fimbriimonas sp.]|nr:inorganic diphosphatase [Fimbriimonas sp.]